MYKSVLYIALLHALQCQILRDLWLVIYTGKRFWKSTVRILKICLNILKILRVKLSIKKILNNSTFYFLKHF